MQSFTVLLYILCDLLTVLLTPFYTPWILEIILCSQVLWPFNHHPPPPPLLVTLMLFHMHKHTHTYTHARLQQQREVRIQSDLDSAETKKGKKTFKQWSERENTGHLGLLNGFAQKKSRISLCERRQFYNLEQGTTEVWPLSSHLVWEMGCQLH